VPVDPALLKALLAITRKAESGDRDYRKDGRPVVSPAGAKYAMQVMPATAGSPGFGVAPAASDTPNEYNRVGEGLLSAYMQKYNDPGKTWAAYHSGVGNLNKAMQQYGDGWVKGLGPAGRKYVTDNLAALGRPQNPGPEATNMVDDSPINITQPEDDLGGDSGFGVKDVLNEYRQTSQSLLEVQREEAEARRQQFETARAALEKKRFGPSTAERLFALSAALGRPRYNYEKGFGSVVADIAPALGGLLGGKRKAEEARAEALQQLQSSYTDGNFAATRSSLDTRVKMLPMLAGLAKTQAPSPGVWSDSLGRFVPKDHPVPISSGVHNGQRVVKYSDGTMRLRDANGIVTVYDGAGQKLGEQK
jgi:soluble lytic murein transglycosylase